MDERVSLNPMRTEGLSQLLNLLCSIRVRSRLGGSNPRTSAKQAGAAGFHPRLCGSSHRMRRHKTGMPIPPDIQHRPFHRPHIGHNGGVRQRLHQRLRRVQQSLQGKRQHHRITTLKTGWITTDGIHQPPGHRPLGGAGAMNEPLHRHTKSAQIKGDRTADQAKTDHTHTVDAQ